MSKIIFSLNSTNLAAKESTLTISGFSNGYKLVPGYANVTFETAFDAAVINRDLATVTAVETDINILKETIVDKINNIESEVLSESALTTNASKIASVLVETGTFATNAQLGQYYGLNLASTTSGVTYLTGFEVGQLTNTSGNSPISDSFFRIAADKFILGTAVPATGGGTTFASIGDEDGAPTPVFATEYDSATEQYNISFNGVVRFDNLVNGSGTTIVDGGKINTDFIEIGQGSAGGTSTINKSIGRYPDDSQANAAVTLQGIVLSDGDSYFDITLGVTKYWDNGVWVTTQGVAGVPGKDVNFIFTVHNSNSTAPTLNSIASIPTGWSDSVVDITSTNPYLWSSKGNSTDGGVTWTWDTPKLQTDDIVVELRLYKLEGSTITTPGTYDFSTNTLSGQESGWTTSIPPLLSNLQSIYVTTAVVSGTAASIVTPAWSSPVVYSTRIDGINGTDVNIVFKAYSSNIVAPTISGTSALPSGWSDGLNEVNSTTSSTNPYIWSAKGSGVNGVWTWGTPTLQTAEGIAELKLYKLNDSTISTAGSYNFSTGVLSGQEAGWDTHVPALTTNGDKVYVTNAVVAGAKDSVVIPTWSTPVVYSHRVDGVTETIETTVIERGPRIAVYGTDLGGALASSLTHSQLASYWDTAEGSVAEVTDDQLVLTNTSTGVGEGWTNIYTYDGVWSNTTKLIVHGDAVVDGTIAASKLTVGTRGLSEIVYDFTSKTVDQVRNDFDMLIDDPLLELSIDPIKGLKIGNNSGNDELWFVLNQSLDLVTDTAYTVDVELYQEAGTSTASYVGFAGRNATDTAWVNSSGADSVGSSYYTDSETLTLGAWITIGTNATGSYVVKNGITTNNSNLTGSKIEAHANAKYVRPMALVNYSNRSGICYVKSMTIRQLSNTSQTTIDGGKITTGSLVADRITSSGTVAGFDLDGRPNPSAGGISGCNIYGGVIYGSVMANLNSLGRPYTETVRHISKGHRYMPSGGSFPIHIPLGFVWPTDSSQFQSRLKEFEGPHIQIKMDEIRNPSSYLLEVGTPSRVDSYKLDLVVWNGTNEHIIINGGENTTSMAFNYGGVNVYVDGTFNLSSRSFTHPIDLSFYEDVALSYSGMVICLKMTYNCNGITSHYIYHNDYSIMLFNEPNDAISNLTGGLFA